MNFTGAVQAKLEFHLKTPFIAYFWSLGNIYLALLKGVCEIEILQKFQGNV